MKQIINRKCIECFKMSYDEYEKLDFDEQQGFLNDYYLRKYGSVSASEKKD